jgi:hypothetical protein
MDELLQMPRIERTPSPVDAEPGYTNRDSWLIEFLRTGALWTILSGTVAAGLLLWVAWYNRYPTIFSDTGSYLLTGALQVALAPFRAPGYGTFTHITSLGVSPWFTVATQAILVVYVLYEACGHLIGGNRKFINGCLLAAVCGLITLTSLPWLVSLVMPDVFAGIAFLCIFLLAFASELRVLQRSLLAAILTISVAAHTSLFPLAAVVVATLLIWKLLAKQRECPSAWAAMAWMLLPVLAAGLWTAKQNQKMGLGFRLSPSANSFLLGRLFGDGLAPKFLRANCPKRHFISCRYLSDLPQTEAQFLFWHPLYGELKGRESEIDAIVHGTLAAYPGEFLLGSVEQTFFQLGTLRTGEEARSNAAQEWNLAAIQQVFPADLQTFSDARQFHLGLRPLANAAAVVHTAFFWLSLIACVLFVRTGRFAPLNKFLASAILFLVFNAAICGALAGVYDRYQARVAWLIPFCLIAYICRWVRESSRGLLRQDSTVFDLTPIAD